MKLLEDCPFEIIGKVAGTDLKITFNGEEKISAPVAELEISGKLRLKNN